MLVVVRRGGAAAAEAENKVVPLPEVEDRVQYAVHRRVRRGRGKVYARRALQAGRLHPLERPVHVERGRRLRRELVVQREGGAVEVGEGHGGRAHRLVCRGGLEVRGGGGGGVRVGWSFELWRNPRPAPKQTGKEKRGQVKQKRGEGVR